MISKQKFHISLLLIILLFFPYCKLSARPKRVIWYERNQDYNTTVVRKGLVSIKETRVKYRQNRRAKLNIYLSEPVTVASADREYGWGYFQFPDLGLTDKGILFVQWQMAEDHPSSYAQGGENGNKRISKDGGRTWIMPEKGVFYNIKKGYRRNPLSNGDNITTVLPASKNIRNLIMPKPVYTEGNNGNFEVFEANKLPKDLQGAFLNILDDKTQSSNILHASIYDPGLLRQSQDNYMSVVWLGDIKQMKDDNSLIAGIYPTQYLDDKGKIEHTGVSFYRSTDMGKSWSILSKMPYKPDEIKDPKSKLMGPMEGYSEPSFEVLSDSSLICILRTTGFHGPSPMYKAYSNDRGKTWSTPVPFTPNGVRPHLLKLQNGVLVLVSGRPGVQLRFSFDGKGVKWTDPIDLIDYKLPNDVQHPLQGSCGYAELLESGNNSFYVVYSDFRHKNKKGEERKAILFREVVVEKR